MYKKLFAIILTGALAVSVIACGGNATSDAKNDNPHAETTKIPGTTNAPDETKAPDATKAPEGGEETKAPTTAPTQMVKERWEVDGTTLIIRDNCGMDLGLKASEYPWYKERKTVEHIVIEDGVTVIAQSAFASFGLVKTLTMADSVTRIERSAFDDMKVLEKITLSMNLTYVGDEAFPETVIENKDGYLLVDNVMVGVEEGKTDVIVPKNVIVVATDAFEQNKTMISVEMHTGVKNEEIPGFSGCIALEKVTLGEQMTSVPEEVFLGCKALTDVKLPKGMTEISKSAFSGCTSLTELVIPEGVVTIGDYAFESCSALKEMEIPESVDVIGVSAFRNCESMTSVNIDGDVTTIGAKAFYGTKALEFFRVKGSIVHVGEEAIGSAWRDGTRDKLTIEITGGISGTIGESAFANCSKLTSVKLLEGLSSIGTNAFSGCTAWGEASLVLPVTVTYVGGGAFENCGITELTISSDFAAEGKICGTLEKVNFGEDVTEVPAYLLRGSKIESIELPSGITKIGERAFADCNYLKTVLLPDSLQEIGKGAFANCYKLEELVIPEKVSCLLGDTFLNCTVLAKLEIPAGVEEIARNAIPTDTVIYGMAGSYAETFAVERNRSFVAGTIAESEKNTEEPTETPLICIPSGDVLFVSETVKAAVAPTVDRLRADGLIAGDIVCLTMDGNSLIYDITPENGTVDMVLSVNAEGVYTLALDYDFWFLEGFGPLVNGVDPAPYNKEMLLAFLGFVSEEPAILFNTIDMTYFSSYSLSGTEYVAVGDCYMMDGLDSIPGTFSFKIKK